MTRRLLTIALLAIATAAPLAAQKETPPPAATPKNFTVPAVRSFTLDNGLEVRLVPYGSTPKVDVEVVTQAGNADDPAGKTWLADLTGRLMDEGTTTRSAEEIAKATASMGGDLTINAMANQTWVGGDVLSESGPAFVALVADVVRNPRFPESELARLKTDLVRQLSVGLSQQRSLAQQRFLATLYPDQPYGRLYPTEAELKALTLADVRSFYQTNFTAKRTRVYVAGVFDGAAMEKAIRDGFSSWPAGTAASSPTVSPVSRRTIHLIDKPGAVQSTVYIGLPTGAPTSPDYIPLLVTDALLGGSFGSRITSNIREQKGYTYSPGSSVQTRLGTGYWSEVADVTTNVTGPAIREIVNEIDRLRSTPPSEAELRGIQNYMAGTFVLRNSSRRGIIGQLAFLDLHGLPPEFLRSYVQRIYAVTPAEVQRIATQYLDPQKMTIAVAGDKAQVLKQLEEIGPVTQ